MRVRRPSDRHVDVLHAFGLFAIVELRGHAQLRARSDGRRRTVVATTVGGGGTIDDGVHGLLVHPTSEALAAAIGAALDDPDAAARRAAAARLRIEQEFSFDVRMRKVEQIYEALLDGRQRATPATAVA